MRTASDHSDTKCPRCQLLRLRLKLLLICEFMTKSQIIALDKTSFVFYMSGGGGGGGVKCILLVSNRCPRFCCC